MQQARPRVRQAPAIYGSSAEGTPSSCKMQQAWPRVRRAKTICSSPDKGTPSSCSLQHHGVGYAKANFFVRLPILQSGSLLRY